MKKAFIKYHLPLWILLLSGYNFVPAHNSGENAFHTLTVSSAGSDKSLAFSGENAFFEPASRGTSKRSNSPEIPVLGDEEEDDKTPSRKKLSPKNTYTTTHSSQIRCYQSRYLTKILAFCEHFTGKASYRTHLLYQVFLI